MSRQLFTATGCTRCTIVKNYLQARSIPFEEQDIKANGKEAFKVFYKENRKRIFRGSEGIEFPIFFDGDRIFQGVGVILAYLMADDRLAGFVTRSDLSQGWISGLNIHNGNLNDKDAFLSLIGLLKDEGLMIQMEADGRNSHLLETIVKSRLIHRLIFYLRGPVRLYEQITGTGLNKEDLARSLSVLTPSLDYKIILPVCVFIRENDRPGYLSPEEAAEAAQFAEEITDTKKHPFFIEPVEPKSELILPPLLSPALFKYRTLCRRHMVLCDILKD
ncbi:MAG: hypothetical protein GY729_05915 [Desulfobacteraceae bacterium]|nr:hypothetical protein [Desulfobacteraceae bacterium]